MFKLRHGYCGQAKASPRSVAQNSRSGDRGLRSQENGQPSELPSLIDPRRQLYEWKTHRFRVTTGPLQQLTDPSYSNSNSKAMIASSASPGEAVFNARLCPITLHDSSALQRHIEMRRDSLTRKTFVNLSQSNSLPMSLKNLPLLPSATTHINHVKDSSYQPYASMHNTQILQKRGLIPPDDLSGRHVNPATSPMDIQEANRPRQGMNLEPPPLCVTVPLKEPRMHEEDLINLIDASAAQGNFQEADQLHRELRLMREQRRCFPRSLSVPLPVSCRVSQKAHLDPLPMAPPYSMLRTKQ